MAAYGDIEFLKLNFLKTGIYESEKFAIRHALHAGVKCLARFL